MRAFGGFLMGVIVTLVVIALGTQAYVKSGHPPVATGDTPWPFEAKLAHEALHTRISRELEQPPFQPNEQVLETGAKVYAQECADCHGLPGKPSQMAKGMFPKPPQLWVPHGHDGVVGVSDDPVGHTYWLVHNGVRLSGMPAYTPMYSNDQMWAVSWLVKGADKPQSPQVQAILMSGDK